MAFTWSRSGATVLPFNGLTAGEQIKAATFFFSSAEVSDESGEEGIVILNRMAGSLRSEK